MNISTYDKQRGWVPAIPLPFYYRGWRSLWREKPMCWECKTIFNDERQYQNHYALKHQERDVDHQLACGHMASDQIGDEGGTPHCTKCAKKVLP